MPTVLRDGPYRFFFYVGDGSEPPHIHVERDRCEAKLWLAPVRLKRSRGFSRQEISFSPEIDEIRVPLPFLQDFHIVDTPGVNSVAEGHEAIQSA